MPRKNLTRNPLKNKNLCQQSKFLNLLKAFKTGPKISYFSGFLLSKDCKANNLAFSFPRGAFLLNRQTTCFFRGFSQTTKTIFLLSLFLFLSPAGFSENRPKTEDEIKLDRERFEFEQEQDSWQRARDRRQEQREDMRYEHQQEEAERRREREEVRELEARDRERAQDEREAIQEAQDLAKEREEKCDTAEEEVQTALEEKDDTQTELEQEFYDLEENITELEGKNAEEQTKIKTEIENLNTAANNNTQQLKEEMGKELNSIDAAVQSVQDKISKLHDALEQVEEQRLTAFYARRKQQNEFYSACFGKALEQTETEKLTFYRRKRANTLRRQSIGALMRGGRTQTQNMFSGRFNHFLNLCLNNQVALLQKKNTADEYQLMLAKLNRQEERAEQKIAELKTQIANLNSEEKAEILNRYKEKMNQEIQNFERSYDSLTQNHQVSAQQILQEIGKIKQQQASVLMRRAQNSVPQRTRSTMVHHQCQQQGSGGLNMLNMFPTSVIASSRNRGGIFGGATR